MGEGVLTIGWLFARFGRFFDRLGWGGVGFWAWGWKLFMGNCE